MDWEERRAWGPRIRAARTSRGLSQEELAELAGTTRRTIGSVERGDTVAQREVLVRLLDVLELGNRDLHDDLDADVRGFLTNLGLLLQRLTPAQRADLMPALMGAVLDGWDRASPR